ncbi:hypothetical protein [Paraburkholderia sp. 22B1P]|uniref:hypothetical protein n=1 Tax=Paraburkholderia sp. 22B1P TaxID=3080498 RepID=UPI003088E1BE|nr:hypothetical protein PBP221_83190 [Paraburkholderia sp. 22B1P]
MQPAYYYLSYPGIAHLASAMSLATLLTASTGCAAQTQVPTVQAAPPIAVDAPPPPPSAGPVGPAPTADTGTPSVARGTVSRFLVNPDGDVDGFLTSNGLLVHFPPHLGTQLTSMIRRGDAVQVSGWRHDGGTFTAQRIVDTSNGQQLLDQPALPGTQRLPRQLRGAVLSPLVAQGQVAHVTTAPQGEPDGVILTDGIVIKLTPPVAQQFPTLLQAGANVSAQGYGTRNQYGSALQATAFGTPGSLTQLYDRALPGP